MSVKITVLCFTLIIYILILVAFNKARAKYAGGKIGAVINLILITVILLFIADYVKLFDEYLSENILFMFQSLFRAAALSVLAFGGIRIASE
ncbi:MAG: hypothetical protein DRG25_02535 [Deltaproteobacteria bacterium]|nr:MAG: hypothetical protein DRG25_02535 [Deltaproteobacteria bacterium]